MNKNSLLSFSLIGIFLYCAQVQAMELWNPTASCMGQTSSFSDQPINAKKKSAANKKIFQDLHNQITSLKKPLQKTERLLQNPNISETNPTLLLDYSKILKDYILLIESLVPFYKTPQRQEKITKILEARNNQLKWTLNHLKMLRLASYLGAQTDEIDDKNWIDALHTITEAVKQHPKPNYLDNTLKKINPANRIEALHDASQFDDTWKDDCAYLSLKHPLFSTVTENMKREHEELKRKVEQRKLEQLAAERLEKINAAVKILNTQAIQTTTITTCGNTSTCRRLSQEEENYIHAARFLYNNLDDENVQEAIRTINPQDNIDNLQTHIFNNAQMFIELGKINPLFTPLTKTQVDARKNVKERVSALSLDGNNAVNADKAIGTFNAIDRIFSRPEADKETREALKRTVLEKLEARKQHLETEITKILPRGQGDAPMSLIDRMPSIGSNSRTNLLTLSNTLKESEAIAFDEETATITRIEKEETGIDELIKVFNHKVTTDLEVLNTESTFRKEAVTFLQNAQEKQQLNTDQNNAFNTWKQNNGWTLFKWTWNPKHLFSSLKSTIISFIFSWF